MQPTRWMAIAALVLTFALVSRTQADPDLWGHVRFGLDIVETRSLPSVDPYSFTQDRPWVNHEWLSEVQMALAYRALGSSGLALLKAVLAVTALALIWSALRGVAFEARILAFAVAFGGAAQIGQTLRPQLWSVVAMASLCHLLQWPIRRRLVALPLLFGIWANLHGGWIVGMGVLGLWLVLETASAANRADAIRWNVPSLVLATAATLCTPYGWRLWLFLAETVRVRRPSIEEWQSLSTLGVAKWIPWVVAVAAAIWAARRHFPQRLAVVGVLALLAVASFRVARIVPLFVVAEAVAIAPALATAWPARSLDLFGKSRTADLVVTCGALTVAMAAAVVILPQTLRCIATNARTSPDSNTLAALQQAAPGRLVTFFDWGERAIWYVGPHTRVSMDGRRETVYSERALATHDAILYGTSDAWPTLERWRAEYVWLPISSSRTLEWLRDHDYRVDVETPTSFLAVRADLPVVAATPGSSLPMCFPR